MSPQSLATLDYLAEVAKDWAVSSFASADDPGFTLKPHRFELDGLTVRRRGLARRSREASDPLAAASRPEHPVAWARSVQVVLLTDSPSGPVAYEQEIVEVLAADGEAILAEAAHVVRIGDLPPCIGRFWTAA
jgi:hypothetical protein